MQYLVDHNHDLVDILNYPLSRIGLLLKECRKQDKKKDIEQMSLVWFGTHANGKQYQDYINQMSTGTEILKEPEPDQNKIKNNWVKLSIALKGKYK